MASGPYFIGQSGATYDGAPTPKTVTSFANIRGLSPEAPAKEGSFNAASVANFGLTNDLNPQTNPQNLQTFAVALASPLPKIEIPRQRRHDHVGAVRQIRRRLPRRQRHAGPVSTDEPDRRLLRRARSTPTFGRFRVNFEDVEQGADHDMDAIATYEYTVSGSVRDSHGHVGLRGRLHHSAHGLRDLGHDGRRHLSRRSRPRHGDAGATPTTSSTRRASAGALPLCEHDRPFTPRRRHGGRAAQRSAVVRREMGRLRGLERATTVPDVAVRMGRATTTAIRTTISSSRTR